MQNSKIKWGFLSISFFASLAFLSACNDETTEITNTVGLEKIEEGSSMPKCNSDKDGLMVYVVDSAAAYYCADGKWLSLNGKDGADGKDGSEGKDGKDGDDGKNGKNGDNGQNGKKGDKGDKGNDGTNGDDGKSAYEIANAANKFKSEEEWLNSLKGANGESCKGEVIENGIKITCDNGAEATITNGSDGKNCSVEDNGNGVVTLKCDGDEEGVKLYKAFCGAMPYDPDSAFCDHRDEQLYKTVTIGEGENSQTWMARNLNYATDSSYCNDVYSDNCATSGLLYNKKDARKVCPSGWHLPDSLELLTLIENVGGTDVAGKALKSESNWDGTDDFGFSALPIGRYLTTIERPSSSDPGVVVDPTGIEYSSAEAFFQYNSENPIAYMSVSSDNEKALIEASSDVCIRIVGDTRPCNFHYYKQSVRCIKD